MNQYHYFVIESFCEDFGVPVYGIAAVLGGRDLSEPICCIKNVSPNKETVVLLAERCQRLHLDPIHLLDVIEDFLV